MKLNGLKEEHCFTEIAPKDTKMRIEVILWSVYIYILYFVFSFYAHDTKISDDSVKTVAT